MSFEVIFSLVVVCAIVLGAIMVRLNKKTKDEVSKNETSPMTDKMENLLNENVENNPR